MTVLDLIPPRRRALERLSDAVSGQGDDMSPTERFLPLRRNNLCSGTQAKKAGLPRGRSGDRDAKPRTPLLSLSR